MRLGVFKILLVSCSILFLTGCDKDLKVTVCISDPANGGFQCVDHNKQELFIGYEQSENYIALDPDDFETMLGYYKTKCRRKK